MTIDSQQTTLQIGDVCMLRSERGCSGNGIEFQREGKPICTDSNSRRFALDGIDTEQFGAITEVLASAIGLGTEKQTAWCYRFVTREQADKIRTERLAKQAQRATGM